MKPVRTITGVAAPLPLANVDTDVIIRIEKLAQCPREHLGRWALEPLRFLADGSENPGFILNQAGWREASILVTGPNFACGSSREHAVWALQGLGIGCLIAPSYGDIFRNNCYQNGLLPIQLPPDQVEWLLDRLEQSRRRGQPVQLVVDLENGVVQWPGQWQAAFHIDPRRRQALLQGLDAIDSTRTMLPRIAEWQERDRAMRPWIWMD
ncbi:MAG: 3-isopropylmalate dehydratase small subunit [Burkholderiales bacterium]|nr:3-isopropylmalate dehydratase small subunit [Burkholderiales bacterium]